MRILIVTDAWHPQINGVVRTLDTTRRTLEAMGHEVEVLSAEGMTTFPLPTYPDIRVALFPGKHVRACIDRFAPDHLHISTEGPLGIAARNYAVKRGYRFTTAFHTRFPEYVKARTALPLSVTYKFLRWFHGPSSAIMVPTQSMIENLEKWNIGNLVLWSRGVDLTKFSPPKGRRKKNPAPIYLYVGRVSVEKNIEAFLKLSLDGVKWVVGDGPARAALERKYPDAIFHGEKHLPELTDFYRHADVFVFPSRTDTFGLVMIEAMACGTPVAGYPVTGPKDIITAETGAVDDNLAVACKRALTKDRKKVRTHAQKFSWKSVTKVFAGHLVTLKK
ncbi:MAG: glycosyltransferase family 4 protein [Parvibaculales bacterium]